MPKKTNTTLFSDASDVIAGGVNSPVRAFKSVGGNPVFIERGNGSHVWSAEGDEYIDYVQSWGAMILGHAQADVVKAIQDAATQGMSFGAPTERETILASTIRDAFPSMEKLRLVSSGTEATMSAIRLARGFTGRDKIIKFAGCYHGHSDYLLVAAGSGGATFGIPNSAGVPESFAKHTVVVPYNDPEAIKETFAKCGNEIAALIVEPVAANMGVVPPCEGFLELLRKLCTKSGTLLIFDEVISGFRACYGGAQTIFNITPDLTCLGKIIGGGMPIGAYGGRADVMNRLAPEGDVYQAGTLSGNPVATAAGLETLRVLRESNPYEAMATRAKMLEDGLLRLLNDAGIKGCVNRCASLLTLFFDVDSVENYDQATSASGESFAKFFDSMLKKGVHLPPSAFEAWFVSAAHTDQDIEKTLALAAESLKLLA